MSGHELAAELLSAAKSDLKALDPMGEEALDRAAVLGEVHALVAHVEAFQVT